jgi:hypothetical protein
LDCRGIRCEAPGILTGKLYGINAEAIRKVRGWLENPPACPAAPLAN